MMFLFFFSIKPTPSRTLVMSYILLFCFTANLSAACQSRQLTKGSQSVPDKYFDKTLYSHLTGNTRKQRARSPTKARNSSFWYIWLIKQQIKALGREEELHNRREGRRRREMACGACCVNITQLWRAGREGKSTKGEKKSKTRGSRLVWQTCNKSGGVLHGLWPDLK